MTGRDLMFFDAMLTPKIITFVYWLGLIGCFFGGLAAMFSGRGFSGFIMGLLGMVGGAVATRIWCELLIVMFKVNEGIQKMANKS